MSKGKKNESSQEVKALQEQVQRLKLQNEISMHKAQLELTESLSYSPPYDL